MSNIIIATPVLSDAATLSADDETTAGPVTNLQKMQRTDVWESESTTAYLVIDLGAVTTFNVIALLSMNAVVTDTWRIRTANTEVDLTGDPAQDTTATALTDMSPDGDIFHWITAGWSNRWVRIDMATASSPFMAGRVYVANALEFAVNYQYGGEDGYSDDSQIAVTDGGNLIPGSGSNRAILNFTLNIMSETERHAIRELNRTSGATNDVIVITDPTAATNKQDVLYHGLLQSRRVTITTAFNRNQANYQLTSL